MKTYLILNDLQIPFHDKRVLDGVINFSRSLDLYGVILNGDVVDCYDLSEFSKNPINTHMLEKEITISGELMHAFHKVPSKLWIGGNHEDRLRRYIWRQAPALHVETTDFPALFHLKDYGFHWLPYGEGVKLGKLWVTHGDIVRKHSSYSAKANFEKEGVSVLCGHTHRLGIYYKTNAGGVHASYENGCLCDLNPEYAHRPDWQQGFSVVHVDENGLFNVQQIPVLKRKVFYYGKERWVV